jgi:tRNA-specific 2-thiouridylase
MLRDSLFPVGGMRKSDVRKLAEKFNLPVSDKKDSQGICFIGDVSMEDFLKEFIKSEPGDVLNTKGKAIGRHKGAIYFTIGERHGFDVTVKGPKDRPYYVVSKDMKKNTITVSNDMGEINSLSPRCISIISSNWINTPHKRSKLKARIRYRGEKLPIKMEIGDDSLQVYFNDPVIGLSLGQSIVFYRDDECLGGGIMDQVQANK